MSVEVIPATPEQQPVLANLIELYAHDFSEFREMELGEDGRFGYLSLPLYWQDPEWHPFLVRVKGSLDLCLSSKSPASGTWPSFLSFAGTGGAELEWRSRRPCGGGFQEPGKYA